MNIACLGDNVNKAMNIVEINTLNFSSTGNIMLNVTHSLREQGHHVMVCYPATRNNLRKQVEGSYLICGQIERNIALNISKLTGYDDLLFRSATRRLVRQIDRFGVDVIHLHNLHCWFINLPVLFDYIKKKNIRVVWTFHDCWAMTGHCPHFDMIGCDKWKTECHNCPIYREYPECMVDNSRRMFRIKKSTLTGVENMTIVTPSQWMATIVSQSYFKDYPVQIINNGINPEVFKPTVSNFRRAYQCEGKTLLLGVAMGWTIKKGIDIFLRLANELDDNYRIVLVGTDEQIDQQLPYNIISIHQTLNQEELAAIYSTSNLFVNPTREDTFSTVTIEALSCGTPVLAFRTGGTPEILDATCGSVVEKNDYDSLKKEIARITKNTPFSTTDCRTRALNFTQEKMVKNYLHLLTSG